LTIENILESIEDSKSIARIKMDKAKTKTEKSYFVGMVGGLQLAKQILEKELD